MHLTMVNRFTDYHVKVCGLMMQEWNVSASLTATQAQFALPAPNTLATNCSDRISEEPCPTQCAVVLSIHPKYSKEILKERKKVELRRRFPKLDHNNVTLYIYSTSPRQAMVGVARIKEVKELPVEEIWTKFKNCASIKYKDFEKYFQGLDSGFVLILDNIKPFSEPIPLSKLRESCGFEPPQSFLYVKEKLHKVLQNELHK